MKPKQSRLPIIAEILTNRIVDSQETLLTLLRQQGVEVTQATLSRDLRKLKATKVALETGGFRYMVINHDSADNRATESLKASQPFLTRERINQDILSFSISRNLIVIKTRNGCAGGLAYDIDMLMLPEILGTIPGTDTVLVVVNENLLREQIIKLLMELIPDAIINDTSLENQTSSRLR